MLRIRKREARTIAVLIICAAATIKAANAADQCAMTPDATRLIRILDNALQDMQGKNGGKDVPHKGGMHPNWDAHCSQYVRAVMRQLPSVGINLSSDQWSTEADGRVLNADGFRQALPKSDEFRQVDETEAQTLADSGAVVLGSSPPDSSGHAHVGVAFPIPSTLDPSAFAGSGPFVRDGNEHRPSSSSKGFPSTYGAVRASEAFPIKQTQWYVLKASIPAAPSFWDRIVAMYNQWFGNSSSIPGTGIWIATSGSGGTYRIDLRSPSNMKITPIRPNNSDSVLADQAPSPDEIAIGALVGQSPAAWTAFANDQDHPKTETWTCPPLLGIRSYYSVPPPSSRGTNYLQQTVSRFNFAVDPPTLTTVYDFWFDTSSEKLVKFTLKPE